MLSYEPVLDFILQADYIHANEYTFLDIIFVASTNSNHVILTTHFKLLFLKCKLRFSKYYALPLESLGSGLWACSVCVYVGDWGMVSMRFDKFSTCGFRRGRVQLILIIIFKLGLFSYS